MTNTAVLSVGLALLVTGCGDDITTCDPDVAGQICTIAGTGDSGYAGDEGPALKAVFSDPMDTATAADGTIYVVDWNNHRIRSITTDGIVHHVAGNGELTDTPVGVVLPPDADFNHPTGIIFDQTGTKLFVAAWHNSQVRTIDLTTSPTTVTTSCGDGRRAYFGDEAGADVATLNLPTSIALAPDGALVIMDQANQVIRSVDASNIIHRIAGNCVVDELPNDTIPGPGRCMPGVMPAACAPPSDVTTCGNPATCGTACNGGYTGDEGPAIDMRMWQGLGQATDPGGRLIYDQAGNLYFADTINGIIRMIDTNQVIHRFAGTAPIAGVPQTGYAGDGGPALSAKLNHPIDLAFGADGTLYFTDTLNHCVRGIDPTGMIRTVVGQCGVAGYAGDGGPATAALLLRPYGLEVAGKSLVVTDTGNNRIRQVRLP